MIEMSSTDSADEMPRIHQPLTPEQMAENRSNRRFVTAVAVGLMGVSVTLGAGFNRIQSVLPTPHDTPQVEGVYMPPLPALEVAP